MNRNVGDSSEDFLNTAHLTATPMPVLRAITIALFMAAVCLASVTPAWAMDRCGTLTGNETWAVADGPSDVTCDVIVPSPWVLTIEAGVQVRFQPATGLSVSGQLLAGAAMGGPVTFTSATNPPQAGDWTGLSLGGSATHTIVNAQVEYATIGIYTTGTVEVSQTTVSQCSAAGIDARLPSADLTLTDVTITGCVKGVNLEQGAVASLTGVESRQNEYGLYLYSAGTPSRGGPEVTATGCTFTENSLYGVQLAKAGTYEETPSVSIDLSSIHSNLGAYDLHAGAPRNAYDQRALEMRNNWWGTTDPAVIAQRIYDNADYFSSAIVDWCGWLDGPGGDPAWDVICPDLWICDGPTSWDLSGDPYLMVSNVAVCSTGTLNVSADVTMEVLEQQNLGISVGGLLNVSGSAADPAVFTSAAASPAPGDWAGISLGGSSTHTIEHARIEYATRGIFTSGIVEISQSMLTQNSTAGFSATTASADATLTDVVITHSGRGVEIGPDAVVTLSGVESRLNDYGVHVLSGGSYTGAGPPTVIATDCTFTDNTLYGLFMNGEDSWDEVPLVTVSGSSIHSNLGSYDLYTGTYKSSWVPITFVQARGNWWGTTDPAVIAQRIYDNADYGGSPRADWCGWLDGPEGDPARIDVHCPPNVWVCDGTDIWDLTDKPYLLVTSIGVCATGTLQVNPGVRVRAVPGGGAGITGGTILVGGTPENPVKFTSDAASPLAGDWAGLLLTGTPSAIQYAEIEYATSCIEVSGGSQTVLGGSMKHCGQGLAVTGGSLTAEDVLASQNTHGVYLRWAPTAILIGVTSTQNTNGLFVYQGGTGAPAVVRASGCRFVENDQYGVHVTAYCPGPGTPGCHRPSVTITGSSIHSNLGDYDYHIDDHNMLNLGDPEQWTPDCWWGTTDVEQITQRIRQELPVIFDVFGQDCDVAIARDTDGDGLGDFDDNCPGDENAGQADTDDDGMGDLCDPEPGSEPTGDCDGTDDATDGHVDSDGDGWGDPCDRQPTRADSHPGATEICDARDNDGDALFAAGELTDDDEDRGVACGDCDDTDPVFHVCACEDCTNLMDDDCDLLTDGADPACAEYASCVLVDSSGPEPFISLVRGACGGAGVSSPDDIIRGDLAQIGLAGGSVDLGRVACVAGSHPWDRVTDVSADPDPACTDLPYVFYLVTDTGDTDFGAASTGDPRDTTDPAPPCP